MAKVTMYRQARADGGVRTGIDIDGDSVLECFQEGANDDNPALLWFVDLRLEGDALPSDTNAARKWLSDNGSALRAGMAAAADDLQLGFDPEFHPFRREIPLKQSAVRAEVVVSALRRLDGRQIAENLRGFANDWDSLLADASPLVHV